MNDLDAPTDGLSSQAMEPKTSPPKASIPSAALVRLDDIYNGLKRYLVTINGAGVGVVYQIKPTFERRSKGKMYAISRWTSKYPRWRYEYDGGGVYWSGTFCETRKAAVGGLLEHVKAIEARSDETSTEGDSAVPERNLP